MYSKRRGYIITYINIQCIFCAKRSFSVLMDCLAGGLNASTVADRLHVEIRTCPELVPGAGIQNRKSFQVECGMRLANRFMPVKHISS